nr:unnamed protein product [Callosobruchus analis]
MNFSDSSISSEGNSQTSHFLSNETDRKLNLNDEIQGWAITHQITQVALNDLLNILRKLDNTLPCDSRSLLRTPRHVKKQLKAVNPGYYYHFGLQSSVSKLLQKYNCSSELKEINVCINVDGLPVSKSTTNQFYPILCCLFEYPRNVDIVGLYHGSEKPYDVNMFLKEFVAEAVELINNGFIYNNTNYIFKIKAIICDAPAKSFMLCIKGHTGFSSCTKCHITGDYVNNRVCFPETDRLRLRSHAEFIQKFDEEHHIGTSIIEKLPKFDIIHNVPLDYMHLICLGVVRKLMNFWCFGKPPNKLSYRQMESISKLLLSLKNCIPCEFQRRPRALSEVKRFKATEFREFLFYTGPVVLKPILNHDRYLNYLTLHVASTILCDKSLVKSYRLYAQELFTYFVETFKILYGVEHVSHNIHNLLHISDDANVFGILDQFSAFPVENYLHSLKKLIRKSEKPLEQVISRLTEKDACKSINKQSPVQPKTVLKGEHSNGPFCEVEGTQFQQANFDNFIIKTSEADNCCALKNGSIICVSNFIKNANGIFVLGKKFDSVKDFYTVPCKSSTFNIYLVDSLGVFDIWNLKEINYKCVRLPYGSKWVIFPLLHLDKTDANVIV